MSEAAATLPVMAAQHDIENALLDYLHREGVAVVETALGGSVWGHYSEADRTIYVQAGMTSAYRLATLLHEAHHYRRNDTTPQPQCVEDSINERVAETLIDPIDYAWAESQNGWHTAGIAAALELPKWVIRAYRRVLARQSRAA